MLGLTLLPPLAKRLADEIGPHGNDRHIDTGIPFSTVTRVLAVVPARGGSKGLPGKNVRLLAGMPLIGHSLRVAAAISAIDRCVVSTDSEDIAAVARDLGGDVPFLRPGSLAGDDTPMAPVLRHALQAVETAEGMEYDLVVLIDPTSPARRAADIDEAIAQLLSNADWDGVVSVSQPAFDPLERGVRVAADGRLQRYFLDPPPPVAVAPRHDPSRYLRVNGNFYVWRSDFVRRLEASWLDEGVHGMFEIPESRAFSIDTDEEFQMIEALMTEGLVSLE